MKYIITLLIFISLFSCQQASIDGDEKLWDTTIVTDTINNANIGCRIIAYKGENFNGIIPTTIGGQKVVEIGGLISAVSILPHPNDTTISTLDFSNAHYLRTIGNNAFYGNKYITSIILNKATERLEEGAFADCNSLSSITWSKNINHIGEAAFYNCDGLTSVTLPQNIDTVHAFTFYACGALEEVIFSSKVSYIGERAFANCNRMATINLPKNLTYIGDKAFLNQKRVSSVIIPSKVKEIGEKTFLNCRNLTQLTIKNTSGILITSNTFQSTPVADTEDASIYYPKETNYPEMENWKNFKGRWLAE